MVSAAADPAPLAVVADPALSAVAVAAVTARVEAAAMVVVAVAVPMGVAVALTGEAVAERGVLLARPVPEPRVFAIDLLSFEAHLDLNRGFNRLAIEGGWLIPRLEDGIPSSGAQSRVTTHHSHVAHCALFVHSRRQSHDTIQSPLLRKSRKDGEGAAEQLGWRVLAPRRRFRNSHRAGIVLG